MIFLTGDTQIPIDIRKFDKNNFPIQNSLSKKDYVIICGDFGGIWNGKRFDKDWLRYLEEKNFTTLFIDGNYENDELLNSFPLMKEWHGGKVHFIRKSIIHLMRGQIYNIDDNKIFTFGGSYPIDFEDKNGEYSNRKEKSPSIEEFNEGINNLQKYNFEVDYMITHCCSKYTLEEVSKYMNSYIENRDSSLNRYFSLLEKKVKYKHWYFGHYHIDVSEIKEKQTALFHKIIQLDEKWEEV